ncbi:MAG TPA: hypothetical protein VMT85_15080 [Thermoanaerobaculia bacterium]|nr:hypothetical protein [Thermoanaerobaculia bacterium]
MSEPRDDAAPDELYVGYLPQTPPGIARFVRRTVWLLGALVIGMAILLPMLQSPFDPGFFELGSPRTLTGRIAGTPYPTLIVDAPVSTASASAPGGSPPSSSMLLVDPGKHGALERVGGLDGTRVEATGTLAARPDLAVFELAADPRPLPTPIEEPIADPIAGAGEEPAPGRRVTLRGEIVDSKCFAGVMKPGRDEVHRACAALCIRGGIPPAFVADAGSDGVEVYLLVDADGAPLGERISPWVGQPVEVEGVAQPRGDLVLLRADLDSLRRLERERPAG